LKAGAGELKAGPGELKAGTGELKNHNPQRYHEQKVTQV
jgi:X-X-X-Leu-X-X-Gly heptad repeat protein